MNYDSTNSNALSIPRYFVVCRFNLRSTGINFRPWFSGFYRGISIWRRCVKCTLAVGSIFWYRNRQNQFVINRLNLISQLFLLGFFVYRSLNVSGEVATSEKGIGMLIPIFSIVFLVLANRAIKKDEDLVKSADRLR